MTPWYVFFEDHAVLIFCFRPVFMGVYMPRNMSYHRAYSLYEKVKLGHLQVISHLQRLENEDNEASENHKKLKKKKCFYC